MKSSITLESECTAPNTAKVPGEGMHIVHLHVLYMALNFFNQKMSFNINFLAKTYNFPIL